MITVNGKEVSAAGCSVSDYLEQNQYQVRRIAVERNGESLPKSQSAQTLLKDGDRLEIVTFVGGG